MRGNANELADAGSNPGKSYLFFLTDYYPGIGLAGDRVKVSGRAFRVLECPVHCWRSLKMRGKDLSASSVVLQTASGLQGE